VGIEDSVEEGYNYLKGLIGDTVSDSRIRAYAERAGEMLQFMAQHSHVDYTALPAYMDYYEEVPGYKQGGRSMDTGTFSLRRLGSEADKLRLGHYDGILLPFNVTVEEGRRLQEMNLGAYLLGFRLLLRYLLDIPSRLRRKRDNRVTLGPALVAQLRCSMLDRDIPLWLNSPIEKLLTSDGRVCGAIVKRDGKAVSIGARRGVLLGTGGFAQNDDIRHEYQHAATKARWSASAPGSTGDAIKLGKDIGASLSFMDCAWWSPTYTIPDGRVLALIAGKSNPGSIMVSQLGKRFANEAQPYEDLVKAQYASQDRGESAIPCYLLFDAVFRSKYALGHIKPGKIEGDDQVPLEYYETGLLTRADSLEELAQKLGMDGNTLCNTVEEFNRQAKLGEDPWFGRGQSVHDRYYADKTVTPNPSLGPVEKAPFYALRCDPGDLDTKGGLACDEFGRVLDNSNKVIAGLYAAGNASGAAMGNTYPGAGATIGSAMTFAYIAARHALQEDYDKGRNDG
jgi:3-oxosteroid 1-dehydrogenase